MQDIINSMKEAFWEYFDIGGVSHIILFALAMLVIMLFAKEPKVKRVTVYIPLLALIFIILNPIVYKIIASTYEYSYYRTYWIILLPLTVGAEACIIIEKIDAHKRFVALVLAIVGIMLTGPIVGMNHRMTPVKNIYRLDSQVIEVADIIMADKCEDKKAMVPEEIAWQIRQYKDIKLLYGRTWNVYLDGVDKSVYGMISGYEMKVDTKAIAETAKNTNFSFIVLKSGIVEREAMWEHGFENIGATNDYEIYRSVNF